MVATRRASRRGEPEAENTGSQEKTSMEGSGTSLRTTRSRSRVNSYANNIPQSCPEETKSSETKLGMKEPPDEQTAPDKSKTVDSVDIAGELQGDGDISEAESNCSSVSSLQTPFVRITRRRQIVIPCQPEFVAKHKQSKKALLTGGSRCQEDDDVSEAESCSSTVSGERTRQIARVTRSRRAKTNVSPVREAQTEEISDAESWCSGISTEPSVPFKRVTRSMLHRMQAETPLQTERKSEVMMKDAKLPEQVSTSQTIVISDEEQSTKSDSETEQAPLSSHQINEQPSPAKAKCSSAAVVSSDLKDFISSSPKKMASECIKTSPEKEKQKIKKYKSFDVVEVNEDTKKVVTKRISVDIYEIVESPEEMCNETLLKSFKATENKSPLKCQVMLSREQRNFGQSDLSPRQATDHKNKCDAEFQKLDIRKISQIEEIIEIDKPCNLGSSQKDSISAHTIESSDDDCRTSIVNIDSDTNPEEAVAESSLGVTKTASPKKAFSMSLLTSDESNDSENSDLEEMDKGETSSGNQSTPALDKSDNEGLFVIDKTPGLDSSQPCYLDDKDVADDEKSEESSEFEDKEEEFVDEDLLNASSNILSLSSSIDPGLDIKRLGGLYISFDAEKQKSGSHGVVPLKDKKKDELLQKSIITPDFEKKECIPPLRESLHQLKKQRRAERAKTTGDGWFGMKAPEITEELKNDLKALKMRAAIDPKRFYKKNDREGLPKYFQVGTVVDSPVDFYHARIPKKERKKNIVEELLADSEFRRYNKRKYQDIIAEKAALAAGKKNRKKKKFHK